MLLMHLLHGRQCRYDMRTEVAGNIDHSSLFRLHACKVDLSSTSQACWR